MRYKQARDIGECNKATYMSDKIVEKYSSDFYIDKPELAILYKFEDKLKSMNMLDIGVGGGRTTHYFAELVKEYVGIDYSEKMIKQCKQNFKNVKNATFYVCDVRDIDIFNAGYFDFILFSFNGIDSMSHCDRLEAFKEIRRVRKTGGIFYFSTHNLNCLDQFFSFKISLNPLKFLYRMYNHLWLRINNERIQTLKNSGYAILNQRLNNSNFLRTYYITPLKQINQLEQLGFKNIRVYSLKDGIEIKDERELKSTDDQWLYYLCEV